ncbi:DNA-binding transcriptional regulator, MarR family [Allokutzneria albata]|uniref:DNA-binding transcriptional regulator, MarR family n=1 Tax=Allokutzneria albata TaxID=211114 RepID=A0A1G9ZFH6_ALLAB|nr:DNA-binding transcriptional regulator, MarR family [Allokutzneria albata]
MTEASRVDDETLISLVRSLTVESNRFVDIFSAAHTLHPTDMTALAVIAEAARTGTPMTPGALARTLDLSASATTSVLDRLEQAGHLSRDRSDTDRRKVELRMLPRARALAAEFFLPLARELAKAWEPLSERDRQVVANFLGETIAATARARTASTGRKSRRA